MAVKRRSIVSILLSLLLVQAPVLPQIDRRALDLQARAEALQNRRPTRNVTPPRAVQAASAKPESRRIRTAAATQQQTVQPQPQPQPRSQPPAALRRASGGALDLSEITTICRAASNQADPATFLSRLARTRALSAAQSSSLSLGCAAYFAGRAEAPASGRGTPGL
jgi:hypothetical protein